MITTLPAVIDCDRMSDRSDYLLRVVADDTAHFEAFLNTKLMSIEGIGSVKSSFALNHILHRHRLPTL